MTRFFICTVLTCSFCSMQIYAYNSILSQHFRNSQFSATQSVLPSVKSNSIFTNVLDLFKPKERSLSQLRDGIAKFYDESSQVWLDVWGEHMHHGYYDPAVKKHNHKQAQIDMINRAVDWSYGKDLPTAKPKSTIDVGCGVGGSSRHIVKRFDMTLGHGVSLSPFQITRANQLTATAGLSNKLQYQVADALDLPFANNKFDLTWSMESGEHMPDKLKFMKELVRVTAPGGRVILVTWCHRELRDKENELKGWEKGLLQKINDAYFLPEWCPVSKYVSIANSLGLEDVRQTDWSEFVAPFWPAVFLSALVPTNFFRMMLSGWTTVKGAIATLWMLLGYKFGVVKFVVMTGRKPGKSATATSIAAATAPISAPVTAPTSEKNETPLPPLPLEYWGTEE